MEFPVIWRAAQPQGACENGETAGHCFFVGFFFEDRDGVLGVWAQSQPQSRPTLLVFLHVDNCPETRCNSRASALRGSQRPDVCMWVYQYFFASYEIIANMDNPYLCPGLCTSKPHRSSPAIPLFLSNVRKISSMLLISHALSTKKAFNYLWLSTNYERYSDTILFHHKRKDDW